MAGNMAREREAAKRRPRGLQRSRWAGYLPLLMVQPYARVMSLHVTILLGGFLVLSMGAPIAALVFLVVLKTGIDLRAHQLERRKLAMPALPVAA